MFAVCTARCGEPAQGEDEGKGVGRDIQRADESPARDRAGDEFRQLREIEEVKQEQKRIATASEVGALVQQLAQAKSANERKKVFASLGKTPAGNPLALTTLSAWVRTGETPEDRIAAARALHDLTPPANRTARDQIAGVYAEAYFHEEDTTVRTVLLSLVATQFPSERSVEFMVSALKSAAGEQAEKEHLLGAIRIPTHIVDEGAWIHMKEALAQTATAQAHDAVQEMIEQKAAEIASALDRFTEEHSAETSSRRLVERVREIVENPNLDESTLAALRDTYLVKAPAEVEARRNQMSAEEYQLNQEVLRQIRAILESQPDKH